MPEKCIIQTRMMIDKTERANCNEIIPHFEAAG